MIEFEGKAHYPLDLGSLPDSWTRVFVGEVCAEIQSGFASGQHNSEGNGVPHLRPMNVDRSGRLDMTEVKSVAADADARRIRRGEVLFNNTNSPVLVGKTAPVLRIGELAYSNHMTRLRPSTGIDDRFLAHHLHYLWMGGYFLHRCSKHVNQASISTDTLSETVPLAIPPSGEQQRIVEAIDSYLSRLDAAVASLEQVQAKLKAYRASVLKAAVEGRLVPTEAELARREGRSYEPADVLLARILKERRRRWEEAELARLTAAGKPPKDDRWKAKYEEPVGPDTSKLPALPEGWCWASVDQLAASEERALCDGPFGSHLKTAHYTDTGPRVVRLQNIGDGEFLDAEAHISEDHFNSLRNHEVHSGDLVVASLGAALPRVCMVPSWLGPAIVKADCLRFRVAEALANPLYVLHALNSPETRRRVETLVHGVGRPRIGLTLFRATAVPVPPRLEQERIVEIVEDLLSVAAQASVGVERDLIRCARLRQPILKWAFEGKLVDQDATDEPAEELLARIRAERAAVEPVKKVRDRQGSRVTA